jgi:subfamily B ATP-binding cassette protein MsbA
MKSNPISGIPEPLTLSTADVLRRLWRDWIAAHKIAILTALLLMAIVSATSAYYPYLIRQVFNAMGAASFELIWQIPPLIIAVAAVKGLATYFQVRQVTSLSIRVTTDIQKAMTSHLINADLSLVTAAPAGEYVSRVMNDVKLVREAIIRLANNLIRDVLTIIMVVGVMIWLDWVLTLVVLGVYPLAMRPIITIGKKQRKQSSVLQEQMADVTSLLSETLHGSRMTRAYTLEDHEISRTARAFDSLFDRDLRLLLGRARIDPILEVLGGLAVAGVIAVAGWRVIEGQMEVGDVAGFITALLLLVQPVRGLGTLSAIVQESAAALNRIFALMDTDRRITDPAKPKALTEPKGEIAFNNVFFRYGDNPAVKGVSFKASPGQLVALVGPSGAGKTSVINLIPRLFDVSKGSVTLDKINLRHLKLEDLRRHMALVSQDTILFNDTIANNIRLGRLDAPEKDVIAAAKSAAAHKFIMEQPQGYYTIVGEGGGRLSGGQRQRISIARAILRDAPVLLLDEATSALDSSSERQIQKALDKLTSGRTTIVVAHRLSTVRNADKLIVMDEGKVVETGTHKQLMKKKGLYARLCRLQHFSG